MRVSLFRGDNVATDKKNTNIVQSFSKSLLISTLLFSININVAHASTLFLLSNDLQVCASDNKRYCNEQGKQSFSDDVKQKAVFDITEEALIRVNEFAWTEQEDIKKQIISLLQLVKPKFENKQLTERQFVRALRGISIDFDGQQLAGRDIWQSMYEFEKRNLFDLLEQRQSKSNKRLKTEVSLEHNTNIEAQLAFEKLFEASAKIAGSKRKPRIAVVTGTNRDPYARVDYYLDLFEQLGFNASWLPMDAAMQTAITAKEYESTACDSLEEFQIKRLSSFRRKVLYDDLYKEQVSECKKAEPLVDTLKRMDAVYIADGSPLLNYHAFYSPTGNPSEALKKIQDMFKKDDILVAVEGASINALTASTKPISIISGVVNDIDAITPISFASGSEACNLGADCIALESERDFAVVESAILPFLPDAIIDTQVSKRGKQLRAIHAAIFSQNNRVLGLDEKTAVVIENIESTSKMDVIGSGGLWLFELDVRENQSGIANFTSHYFTHGDIVTLRKSNVSVEFPSWKFATQLASGSQPNVTSAQVFARNNFYKINEMMCKTGAKQATGNDTINEQNITLSISQSPAALSRLGVVKKNGAEFQVCSLSDVSNSLSSASKL